jgi:hypothetical protein
MQENSSSLPAEHRQQIRAGRSPALLSIATALLLSSAPVALAAAVSDHTNPTIGATDADKRRPAQKSSKPAPRQSQPKANNSRPSGSGSSSAKSNRSGARSSGSARPSGGGSNAKQSTESRSSKARPAARPAPATGARAPGRARPSGSGDTNASGAGSAPTQAAAGNASRNRGQASSADRRRPLSKGATAGSQSAASSSSAPSATTRPDYRYSYDRAASQRDRSSNRNAAARARADKQDHRRDHGSNDDRGGSHDARPGRHDNNHKNTHGGHAGYNKKNRPSNHKTVNNYYYGHGGGYSNSWWRPYSYYCPSYSIGYNSFHDGLSFSIGFGGVFDDWCGVWPSSSFGYSNYRPYYSGVYSSYGSGAIVVIDDDDPEVVYVPVETAGKAYDFDAGWEHLATGREEDALKYFSTRVQQHGDSSSAKFGYAIAAAQMNDRSRAVWSMRRAFRIDDGELGYLPLDTRLLNLAALLESRYAYDAEGATGRELRDSLFMVAALRYVLHDAGAALEAAYAARDAGDHDSSLDSLIRSAEADLGG